MKKLLILTVAVLFISSVCFAQVPHLLNVFAVDSEGWNRNFGAEIGSIAMVGGQLTWQCYTASGAISDPYNNAASANYLPSAGGVDLTGLSYIVFHNLGYTGGAATNDVQFFTQASYSSSYVALTAVGYGTGDVTIPQGTYNNYTVSLSALNFLNCWRIV